MPESTQQNQQDGIYYIRNSSGRGRQIDWSRVSPEKMRIVNDYLIQYTPMVRGAAICAILKFKGADFDEVFSAGMLSLANCALRFKPELGWQFSTYAMNSIYRRCYTAARGKKQTIRIRQLTEAIQLPPVPATLNLILEDEDRDNAIVWMREALRSLDEHERIVIERIFINGWTLGRIATEIGYSRQWISQIRDKVMHELVVRWKIERERRMKIEDKCRPYSNIHGCTAANE